MNSLGGQGLPAAMPVASGERKASSCREAYITNTMASDAGAVLLGC